MTHAPLLSTIIREQLGACEIEYLPSVEPRERLFLSICLLQVRPERLSVLVHGRQPVLHWLALSLFRHFTFLLLPRRSARSSCH